jgi:hypothetical protein
LKKFFSQEKLLNRRFSTGRHNDTLLHQQETKCIGSAASNVCAPYCRKNPTEKTFTEIQQPRFTEHLLTINLFAHPSERYMSKKYGMNECKEFAIGDQIIAVIEKKYYKPKSRIIEGYGVKLLP